MNDDVEEALAEAYEAALAHEKAGRLDEAAKAYREVLALNPADPGGAAVRLAAIGRGEVPDKAPAAYVATLFDQHAEVFDGILVDQLGYAVPMMVRERVQALGLGPFRRMLDLGCGTGLSAEALEDMAAHITGVDLAEGMIEIADEKELFHDLYVADAELFLAEIELDPWDLIAATDVLPYLGDAAPFFGAVARRLEPAGVFVFSTETESAATLNGRSWMVTPHHRYAHDRAYIERMLAAAGLSVTEITDIIVRHERGAPIPGHLVFATRI